MNTELILGNSLNDWLISLAIIAGAVILNKIIILVNKHFIRRLTAKTSSRIDDILFQLLQAPVLFGVILAAIWFAVKRLALSEKMIEDIHDAYLVLIIINITWFIVRLTRALMEEFWNKKSDKEGEENRMDPHMIILIRRTITVIIWVVGLVIALSNIGINISALLGTLGIGGLAFALAAQDTIKNIFGGLTIVVDRPFKLGDRIVVDGVDGIVEDIGVRSVRIRTLARQLVTIPNSKISDATIQNITAETMRRNIVKIGLTYDTTPEKMNEATEILKNLPQKIDGMDPNDRFVFFSDFAASSLEITFIYFIKKEADILGTISAVNMEILKAFNAAGLSFAFPTQTIHLADRLPNE